MWTEPEASTLDHEAAAPDKTASEADAGTRTPHRVALRGVGCFTTQTVYADLTAATDDVVKALNAAWTQDWGPLCRLLFLDAFLLRACQTRLFTSVPVVLPERAVFVAFATQRGRSVYELHL